MQKEHNATNSTNATVQENKALIMRLIEEVWNNNSIQSLDDLLDPTYYDHSYTPRNREGFERTLAAMQEAFPGHRTTIEEIVGEGNNVAVCQTLRGTHTGPFRGLPASGKQIEIGGYRFYSIVHGKIVSHRALLDLPSLLQQIGNT